MEEIDFIQSRFGHPDLTNFGQQFWPKPILANPILANPNLANPILTNPIWANPFLDLVCVMVGPPEGWGPKGGSPKFRAHSSSFFLVFVEFWWCLKRRDAQMCAFGVLWLSCEAPAARSGGRQSSPRVQGYGICPVCDFCVTTICHF